MIIGRFAENPMSGVLIGHIRSLFFKSDKVVFEPVADPSPNRPSHRIYTADEVELGAAWRREAHTSGQMYYSVTLDDPTFAAAIRANLVRAKEGGYMLVWDRQAQKAA